MKLRDVLKTKPMPFQYEGIRFLQKTNGKAVLADDMGLGKTIQALGFIAIHPEARPAIVVCPAVVKYVWEDQIKEHTRMSCVVLSRTKPYEIPEVDIVVINYDILHYWVESLLLTQPNIVIFDEAHYIKNQKAKRTKAAKRLAFKSKHKLALTGTPIVNKPIEFFTMLNIINPREFPSYWKFGMRYCDPKPGWRGQGWNFDGASKISELREKIAPNYIRRLKEEVLKDLPPIQTSYVHVDLSNQSEYDAAYFDFIEWYKRKEGEGKTKKALNALALVQSGQLRQVTGKGKIPAAKEWIKDYLESGKKLVVFCFFRETFNELKKHFPKAALGGGNSHGEIKRFQTDPKCNLFIGTTADSTGITLTSASSLLFLEWGYVPGQQDQARDRIYRIGQNQKVNIYYMVGRNTIDEKILGINERKRKVIKQVVDGTFIDKDINHVDDLIESLIGEENYA